MFSFLKKVSSKAALGGAEDAIDEAAVYIDQNPHEKFAVLEMSKQLFEHALNAHGILPILDDNEMLSSILNIPLDDDFWSENDPDDIVSCVLLSESLYTPEFHRTAYEIKQKCSRYYARNTAEWAASNLAMAGCSILGASPEQSKRTRVWKQLATVWNSEI